MVVMGGELLFQNEKYLFDENEAQRRREKK
jgi:hypothetical protein